jgi:hypothetical protein
MAFFSLLAIAVGILSAMSLVVVGLVEAPWPVLLTGLLAALYGLQRIVQGTGEGQMLGMPLRSHPLSQAVTQVPIAPESKPEPAAESSIETSVVDSAAETAEEATGETYELTYRGIRYRVPKAAPISEPKPANANPSESPQPSQSVVEGIYRGQRWRR